MAERLRAATSPYLLAHADNPVDWYPWGDEAFAAARRRDVPVFLSIGYSACHWCHVMAHESFENPQVAAILNDRFVNIKVDREELPAVDARYLQATQVLTGTGGWPMSVWLDHDRRPWYAGTYFPAVPSHGSPSFVQVLLAVSEAWQTERDHVAAAAMRVDDTLRSLQPVDAPPVGPADWEAALRQAVDGLARDFDPVAGGFGTAPKFPPALVLQFLLRWQAYLDLCQQDVDPRVDSMIATTMEHMACGGLFDQLAGGFARYSVDRQWVVPHFEKMLYDNALLVSAYTEWYAATGSHLAESVVAETVAFLLRELMTDHGAFASALDADSIAPDGTMREGAFYVWSFDEVCECVGEQAAQAFGVTLDGTFEAEFSVLQAPQGRDEQRIAARDALLARRSSRSRPARDDKVVVAWNALAIEALARAATVFGRPEWLEAATRAADHIVTTHADEHGLLHRVSRDGQVARHAPGVLEDYALLAKACTTLAQARGEQTWLAVARRLLDTVRAEFAGDREGTLTDTSARVRDELGLADAQVDPSDNVTPSGWAATLDAAVTLASLTNDAALRSWAESLASALVPMVRDHPRFAGRAAAVLTAMVDGPREVALDAPPDSAIVRLVGRMTAPGAVSSFDPASPLLQGRSTGSGQVYVCRHFVCDAPTGDVDRLRALLRIR